MQKGFIEPLRFVRNDRYKATATTFQLLSMRADIFSFPCPLLSLRFHAALRARGLSFELRRFLLDSADGTIPNDAHRTDATAANSNDCRSHENREHRVEQSI